ncbi:MAG: hypothetical protein KAS87_06935, partial [Candidatus Omnitrophica bacterium]|nr:hypothetical protein [Candidatus Omnitrophota bacterium]
MVKLDAQARELGQQEKEYVDALLAKSKQAGQTTKDLVSKVSYNADEINEVKNRNILDTQFSKAKLRVAEARRDYANKGLLGKLGSYFQLRKANKAYNQIAKQRSNELITERVNVCENVISNLRQEIKETKANKNLEKDQRDAAVKELEIHIARMKKTIRLTREAGKKDSEKISEIGEKTFVVEQMERIVERSAQLKTDIVLLKQEVKTTEKNSKKRQFKSALLDLAESYYKELESYSEYLSLKKGNKQWGANEAELFAKHNSVYEKYESKFNKAMEQASKDLGLKTKKDAKGITRIDVGAKESAFTDRLSEQVFGRRFEKLTTAEVELLSQFLMRHLYELRISEGNFDFKMEQWKEQFTMIRSNMLGEIASLEAKGGKSFAYMFVFGERRVELAKKGEKLNAEFFVAKEGEIGQFVKKDGDYYRLAKFLGFEIVDSSKFYSEKGNKDIVGLTAKINEDGNKVIIYDVHSRGHLQRETLSHLQLADAFKRINIRVVDECDVAAMAREMFIEGIPQEVQARYVQRMERLSGEIYTWAKKNGHMGENSHLRMNKLFSEKGVLDARLLSYVTGKKFKGEKFTASEVSNALRAMLDVKTEQISFHEGGPFVKLWKDTVSNSKDQSSAYLTIAWIEAGKPGKLELTTSGYSATISQVFSQGRGKKLLHAGGSGTILEAEKVARSIYGVTNVRVISSTDAGKIIADARTDVMLYEGKSTHVAVAEKVWKMQKSGGVIDAVIERKGENAYYDMEIAFRNLILEKAGRARRGTGGRKGTGRRIVDKINAELVAIEKKAKQEGRIVTGQERLTKMMEVVRQEKLSPELKKDLSSIWIIIPELDASTGIVIGNRVNAQGYLLDKKGVPIDKNGKSVKATIN